MQFIGVCSIHFVNIPSNLSIEEPNCFNNLSELKDQNNIDLYQIYLSVIPITREKSIGLRILLVRK